ncbi:hypothetical protein ACFZAV_18460 [Streptomyces sp. NPDC008343]|uniref:hypothetical protein n=1 Tax=Streptomyces sp. NPDC008343 TaxID=3364828 RepID=UPI0036E2B281
MGALFVVGMALTMKRFQSHGYREALKQLQDGREGSLRDVLGVRRGRQDPVVTQLSAGEARVAGLQGAGDVVEGVVEVPTWQRTPSG